MKKLLSSLTVSLCLSTGFISAQEIPPVLTEIQINIKEEQLIESNFIKTAQGVSIDTLMESHVLETITESSTRENIHATEADTMVKELKKHMLPAEQIPSRIPGMPTPEAIIAKKGIEPSESEKHPFHLFAPQTFSLMPYLDGLYHLGNTCIEPNALLEEDLISSSAQSLKSTLSQYGIYYAMDYGINYTGISGALPKEAARRSFASQNGSILANINLLRNDATKEGIFLSSKLILGDGFGFDENTTNPRNSIGSLQNSVGAFNGQQACLTQVALAYIGGGGKFVAAVGQLDVTGYMDTNAYANYHTNNLTHGAFDRNSTLPIFSGSWGYHAAFQPNKSFYSLFASISNNTLLNHNPFNYISTNNWTNLLELGFIAEDAAGLGQGIYRILPFLTTHDSHTGGGVAINIQQQLGKQNHLGYFFRGGWANEEAASITGVRANIATGLALLSPFYRGDASNAGYLGLGLLWLQGANAGRPYNNSNEYGLELTYVQQMTPTMVIQPDIQIIKNPVHGRQGQTNVVFQIQNKWNF